MSRVRRALVVTTVERYLNLVTTVATTVVVSRLLTPAEIGAWAIGMAIANMAMGAREFATGNFLVQRPVLSREEIRGAFTVMLVVSTMLTLALIMLAPSLAWLYGESGLVFFLRIAAIAILLEVVAAPLTAMMRRDMAFADLAIVNISMAGVFSAVCIALAALGFSYMSFAWAWIAAAITSAVLALYLRRDWWMLQPLLRHWRNMLSFGGYNGVNVLLFRIYEMLPTIILSRTVSLDAVGLYNRTLLILQMPDKLILGPALPVILPALSAEVRAGRTLRAPYLRAVALVTAVQWPALLLLALLAEPVVRSLLGHQWLEIVPLVRIMAIASLCSFTTELNYPVLVSVGAMRDLLVRGVVAWPLSATVIAIASLFGLFALVLSSLIIIPMQAYISFWFVRRRLNVAWTDLLNACWPSAAVAACSVFGPLLLAAWLRLQWHSDFSLSSVVFAGVLAVTGWLVGLRLTGHPMLSEMRTFAVALLGQLRRRPATAALAADRNGPAT
jgi:O-antigen/teichoic acid export membrane protein